MNNTTNEQIAAWVVQSERDLVNGIRSEIEHPTPSGDEIVRRLRAVSEAYWNAAGIVLGEDSDEMDALRARVAEIPSPFNP